MTKPMSVLGSALALLTTTIPASASTFLAMDLPDLAAHSDAVIRGEVLSVHSAWDAEHRVILTEAELRIDERLVGDVGQVGHEIRVKTFGGTVGDYTIVAHGFPTFEAGQELVLFVARQPDRSLQVTGYQLGQYQVLERGGVDVVVPAWDGGTTLVDRKGKVVPGPEALPLADLRDQLRTMTSDPH